MLDKMMRLVTIDSFSNDIDVFDAELDLSQPDSIAVAITERLAEAAAAPSLQESTQHKLIHFHKGASYDAFIVEADDEGPIGRVLVTGFIYQGVSDIPVDSWLKWTKG